MAMSRKEQLRRKKNAERKRRERIREDPELLAEENRKRRASYARDQKKRNNITVLYFTFQMFTMYLTATMCTRKLAASFKIFTVI